jgi:hypothetical protein
MKSSMARHHATGFHGGEDMRADRTIGISNHDRGFEDGLKGLPNITGSYVMATAEQWDPDDARVSRPDACPVKAQR